MDDWDDLDDWLEDGVGFGGDSDDEDDPDEAVAEADEHAAWWDDDGYDDGELGTAAHDVADPDAGEADSARPEGTAASRDDGDATTGGSRTRGAGELGTATAVAGWLLDQQADRIAAAVRQTGAAGPAPTPARPEPAPPDAPWRRLTGPPLDPASTPLELGDVLEPSRLRATIDARLRSRRPLALEARARLLATTAEVGFDLDAVAVTIVVSDLTPAAPVWVMFEERPDGFATARLLPVFDGVGPPGRAYCFVDGAEAAVRAVAWGLERYGLGVGDLIWHGGG
jgi:hypothetical protein